MSGIQKLSISGNASIVIIFDQYDHFTVESLTPIECSLGDGTLLISPVAYPYEDMDGKIGYTKPKQSFCQWLCGRKTRPAISVDKLIWKFTFNCSVNINLIESFDDAKVYVHDLANKLYLDKKLDITSFDNSLVELHSDKMNMLNIYAKGSSNVELWVKSCEAVDVGTEGKTTVKFISTICKSLKIHSLRESCVTGFKATRKIDVIAQHDSSVSGKLCEMADDIGYCSVGKSKIEIERTDYIFK